MPYSKLGRIPLILKHIHFSLKLKFSSNELNLVCLHFDPKKASEYQVIQTLTEQFSGRLSDVQLNHKSRLRSTQPNDRSYPNQQLFWELVSAHKAWTKATGGTTIQGDTIVLAMVDDGLDTTHLDIQKNIWRNHNEIPNDGIDNDNNGYIDDYYGWNSYDNNGKLIEQDEKARHGTPVAGLMGADGNNDSGVTGGNWNVKILTVVGGSTDEAGQHHSFRICAQDEENVFGKQRYKRSLYCWYELLLGHRWSFSKSSPIVVRIF